jgi:hypothetical protein
MINLKFRALNPETNEFSYAEIQDTDEMNEWVTWELPEDSPINTGERWDVNQFTGKQDGNGVDMYQQDICLVDGLGYCIVDICPNYGVIFICKGGQECPVIESIAEGDEFKIVGNTFQNAELMK